MNQTLKLFTVALAAGTVTLGGYKLLDTKNDVGVTSIPVSTNTVNYTPTNFSSDTPTTSIDFTVAAEKTVNSVVHVINKTVSRQPTNMMEYIYGGGQPKAQVGTGSGVIITPDGYIITNNHVIDNATQLEVTLNNNATYKATLVGTDPKTDIALIKIDAEEPLPFVPFSDSNNTKVGEWVLAVGNPFRLTSTVTAGIVSAKARDLDEFDGNPQSFIQTDAAVNRGNSGGALVNTRGELIGINTAITSETGSYVGYAFAVPSNIARKVVEDIMEFGNVQRAVLGISGGNLNTQSAKQWGVSETEGVYVGSVEEGSGAASSGIRKGDIIKELDGYQVGKFSDLSGYLGAKRPNDVVKVTVLRDGDEKVIPVTLIKLETYEIKDIGVEVRKANSADLQKYGLKNGVEIIKALTKEVARYGIEGNIIIAIDDIKVNDVDEVKDIMTSRKRQDPIKMTFVNKQGETHSYIFR
ncbi:S1C family serine protease [Patiriisocius marinus]|uniref:S1C family serine protease n=1 Tax=Patiriisocius marinus TaxID=1397112 RepID=UPI00232EA337|nr:trypsin-like peptidase domain-containing protein [Patiriisocius marinus]